MAQTVVALLLLSLATAAQGDWGRVRSSDPTLAFQIKATKNDDPTPSLHVLPFSQVECYGQHPGEMAWTFVTGGPSPATYRAGYYGEVTVGTHNPRGGPRSFNHLFGGSLSNGGFTVSPDQLVRILSSRYSFVVRSEAIPPGLQPEPRPLPPVEAPPAAVAPRSETPRAAFTTSPLLRIGRRLKQEVMGQDAAVEAIVRGVQREHAKKLEYRTKPFVAFMDGPTGVGKTELAKQLADTLGVKMIRIDMAEYKEKHNVARLTGAPPGYEGHKEGSALASVIAANPDAVILFDEAEKAHDDVFDALLAPLGEGRLTDGKNQTVDMRRNIILFSSNLSASGDSSHGAAGAEGAGAESPELADGRERQRLRGRFKPEFVNRLDVVTVFKPLSPDVIKMIARKFIRQTEKAYGQKLVVSDDALSLLVKLGHDSHSGARGMERAVNTHLSGSLALGKLAGRFLEGDVIKVGRRSQRARRPFTFHRAP